MNLLNQRRNLMATKIKNVLPCAYQRVEYLESTGTQFIDTGYKLNNNCDTELVIEDLVAELTLYGGRFFGAWTTSTQQRYSFNIYGSVYLAMGYNNESSNNAYIFGTKKTKISGVKNLFYVDDALKYEFANASFETQYTAYLFATHVPEDVSMINPSRLKIYHCKIWDNNKIVRDFVPCYRKADNVAGMYDLANGVFYTNQGIGEFLIGKNVN